MRASYFLCVVFPCVLCLPAVPALADDKARANELFVEAAGLLRSAESAESAAERHAMTKAALDNLHEIVARYPSTDLAVKRIR